MVPVKNNARNFLNKLLFFIVKMVEIKMCLYLVFNLLFGRPSFCWYHI
jgi:hypothetical protein